VPPAGAGRVAAEAAGQGLDVDGVFTHGGHGYAGPDRRAAAADDEVVGLARAADALRAAGIEARVVSAGSTPTAIGSARGVVTEERPGTYVFGDRQQASLGSVEPDAIAAVVAATVVSVAATDRRVVLDAGAKALAKDVAPYLAGHGEVPELGGAIIERLFDYHGVVVVPDAVPLPSVGDVVLVVPNHICPVVNLVEAFTVVRGGHAVDRWRVDARGRNG
jgi:D-serine deaminase-like pyridoxal phosphate-dependent protein